MVGTLSRVILLWTLGLVVACNPAPTSTTRPSEWQLKDERARVANGDTVGESLKSPAIAIDSLKLSVNDETVAAGAIFILVSPDLSFDHALVAPQLELAAGL